MTETQWLTSESLRKLLGYLYNLGPNRKLKEHRKLRLFQCACCRRLWHLLVDERSRRAIEATELDADGLLSPADLASAREGAATASGPVTSTPTPDAAAIAARAAASYWTPHFCADMAARAVAEAAAPPGGSSNDRLLAERRAQVGLLRCVFGNPFRPVTLDPAWHTRDVRALAHAAYQERTLPAGTLEPARLAVLADALEDAGCSHADLLGHLRGPGEHVRGCWAIDRLTGRG